MHESHMNPARKQAVGISQKLVMMQDISGRVGSPRMRLEYKLMNASMQIESAHAGIHLWGKLLWFT